MGPPMPAPLAIVVLPPTASRFLKRSHPHPRRDAGTSLPGGLLQLLLLGGGHEHPHQHVPSILRCDRGTPDPRLLLGLSHALSMPKKSCTSSLTRCLFMAMFRACKRTPPSP